jgi:putative membrane protein insertion efficiency factor
MENASPEPDPKPESTSVPSPAAWLLGRLVRGYQLVLSPLKGGPTCRFHPTCSAYALEALQTHGALHGSWLALRRVGRCHPFSPGGHDPVPQKREPHR